MELDWFIRLNGALYVIICVFTVPLHILVSWSIIRTGSIKKRITLRILLSLAFADIIQLICQGIAGLSICIDVELNDTFNDIMGFLMNGLWAVTLIQHVTLALNRLKVVSSKRLVQEEDFHRFDTIIVVSWIWGLAFTCCYCIQGYHNLYFDAKTLDWAVRGDGFTIIIRILFWFRLSLLTAGILASFIVIATLIINRRSLDSSSQLFNTRDLRLFIQTTTVFILAITHVATWNLVSHPNMYLLAVLNMEWVLVCALLPYLNLAMSSDIRSSLLRVLKFSKQPSNSSKIGPITVFNISAYRKAPEKR